MKAKASLFFLAMNSSRYVCWPSVAKWTTFSNLIIDVDVEVMMFEKIKVNSNWSWGSRNIFNSSLNWPLSSWYSIKAFSGAWFCVPFVPVEFLPPPCAQSWWNTEWLVISQRSDDQQSMGRNKFGRNGDRWQILIRWTKLIEILAVKPSLHFRFHVALLVSNLRGQ